MNARVPGLVGLLELITDGRAPDTLSGQIQLGMELLPFLQISKSERWRFGFDVPTGIGDYRADLAPTGFTTAVPAREWWMVTAYSVRIVAPNGRLLSMAPTIWRPAIGSVVGIQPWIVGQLVSSLTVNVGGASTTQLTAYADNLPILVPPQTEFGYSILDWAGAGAGTLPIANLEFIRIPL